MAKLYGSAIKISWLGADHTYVTSSDGGVWPCWGRKSGGRTICSGTGSSKQANSISQINSWAGIIYGVSGVCHQTANRILYPAGCVVSQARGYWASVIMYGTYGTNAPAYWLEWEARKALSKTVSGDLSPKVQTITPKVSTKKIKEPIPEPGMKDYLDKVNAIYSKHSDKMKMSALPVAKKIDFLGQELELMADYRLGTAKDSAKISVLRKVQGDLLSEKEDLAEALTGKDISATEYAEKVNGLMANFMEESDAQLGREEHIKLFGMDPDTVFQIVDAKILAKYH